MRRSRSGRRSPQRPQIGFEPLEPREMLFADAGFDWWAAWDTQPADDWSWTFDDTWTSDVTWDADASTAEPTGEGSWTDDRWVDEAVTDDSGIVTEPDIGEPDTGASEPATEVAVAPIPIPIPFLPPDEPPVVVTPFPDVTVVDTSIGNDEADQSSEANLIPVSEEVVAEEVVPPVLELPAEVTPDAGPVDDEPVDDAAPIIDGATDTTDITGESEATVDPQFSSETDPLETATPDDVVPGPLPAVVDAADDNGDDPVVLPSTVPAIPVATGPTSPAAGITSAPVAATQPATNARSGSIFGAWGGMFFQAFGRPAGDADGSLSGGQASGQPGGSGRPRIRLPFRPVA